MTGGINLETNLIQGLDTASGNTSNWFQGYLPGTQVTPGNSKTKGLWTTLIANTKNDVSAITYNISFQNVNQAPSEAITIDFAIGPSGSETIIIPEYLISLGNNTGFQNQVTMQQFLPLNIPKGTRISARGQGFAADASSNTYCVINMSTFSSGSMAYTYNVAGYDVLGYNASTMAGTAITPGNGVFGSWTQLIPSTNRDYVGFWWLANLPITQNSQNIFYGVQFGIGPAGQETLFVADQHQFNLQPANAKWQAWPVSDFLPFAIPAGSRLSAQVVAQGGLIYNPWFQMYGAYQ